MRSVPELHVSVNKFYRLIITLAGAYVCTGQQSASWPKRTGGRVAKRHQNVRGLKRGVPLPREFFFNFQVKIAGFYALILRETTCGEKPGTGKINRPP